MKLGPGFLILAAGIGLTGCATVDGTAESHILFNCQDKNWSVQLIGTDSGQLVLTTKPLSDSPITGNSTSNWQEIRSGHVTGQEGGHQRHIRLFDGRRHTILFEGRNGQLSDDPGRTYAGVASFEPSDPQRSFAVNCAADTHNANVAENVRAWLLGAGLPAPIEEVEGGEFDAWY